MDNTVISENIKHFRKLKNLSQYSLAELAGINEKTITRAESGKILIKLDILYKIAKALEIPVFKFFIPNNTALDIQNKELLDIINSKISNLSKEKLIALNKITDALIGIKEL